MAALVAGKVAPNFTLPTVDGKQVALSATLAKGPAVLVFFKINCPVCQYALPFLERLHRAHHGEKVTVLGISQNNRRETLDFMREYGVTFPVALDDPAGYAVSNAYGLTNVPTVFYIAPNGEIEISSVSWSKAEIEAVHEKLTAQRSATIAPLWHKGEEIAEFRPG